MPYTSKFSITELTQSNVLLLDSGLLLQFAQGVRDNILLFKKPVSLIFNLGEHFVVGMDGQSSTSLTAIIQYGIDLDK